MKSWFRENADHLLLARIPMQGVSDERLVANDSYLRIWVSESFLAQSTNWFTEYFPAVHTTVRLKFADDRGATFTTVARLPQNAEAPGVYGGYCAMPLTPYRGGTVELEAGLAVVRGANAMAMAFDLLQDFSGLIGPPLSEVVGIADRITGGVQRMLAAGEDETVLGLHQTFELAGGGGAELRPGFWAVINTSQGAVDPNELRVVDGRLHVVDGAGTASLRGRDYMLFRIEGRTERDDWRFKRFDDLIGKASEAHFRGDLATFTGYRNAVLAEVLSCHDLVASDRIRVAKAIHAECAAFAAIAPGVVGGRAPDLASIVATRLPTRDEVAGLDDMTLQELLDDSQL